MAAKFITQIHKQKAKVEEFSECYISVGTGFTYLGYEAIIIAPNKNALRKVMSGLHYAKSNKDKLKPYKLNKDFVYGLATFVEKDVTTLDKLKKNNKRKTRKKR